MGLSLQPVQTRTLLTEGMDHAAIAEQYYEPLLVNIIPYACHACPTKRYSVTNICQGCLAASCQSVCPKMRSQRRQPFSGVLNSTSTSSTRQTMYPGQTILRRKR